MSAVTPPEKKIESQSVDEFKQTVDALTISFFELPPSDPSLSNWNFVVISQAPQSNPIVTDGAIPLDDTSFEEQLEYSWSSLQQKTNEDPTVPPSVLFPEDYPEHPLAIHLKPIKNTETGENWDLCANWIKNPADPNQTFAVFPYPRSEEIVDYWILFSQYGLSIVDLTQEADHPKLQVMQSPFRFYPSEQAKALTNRATKEELIRMKRAEQIGPIATYEYRKPESPKCKTEVYHYSNWPDGDTIDIQALDSLVDYVLNANKVGIHCRAGVGRTGTLTTAAFIKHLIRTDRIQKENFTLDWLSDFILKLRQQRSKDWICNIFQYKLIYEYGLWLFAKQPHHSEESSPR